MYSVRSDFSASHYASFRLAHAAYTNLINAGMNATISFVLDW